MSSELIKYKDLSQAELFSIFDAEVFELFHAIEEQLKLDRKFSFSGSGWLIECYRFMDIMNELVVRGLLEDSRYRSMLRNLEQRHGKKEVA